VTAMPWPDILDEALRHAFSQVRMIPPVDRRVVAMIIGVQTS